VWDGTANVWAYVEALDWDDNLNGFSDLFVHVDVGSGSWVDTAVLDVENALADPLKVQFANQPNPAGDDGDWFRFSASRSSSTWSGDTAYQGLTKLYWDFGRDRSIGTGYYYRDAGVGAYILRVHSFGDHVSESRPVQVALELMRPDEDPDDTTGVAQRVVQITLTPNAPPTASFTYSCDGLTCTFTDGSSDPDGTIVSWAWTFGDGDSSGQQNPTHVYDAPDSYTLCLIVTDNGGKADTATQPVPVGLVTVTGPEWITTPRKYTWFVTVGGGTPPYTYQWWYQPLGPGGEWQLVGSGSKYSLYVGYANFGFLLRCNVSDAGGPLGSDTHLVFTEWGYGPITGGLP
jgi:hypothetical protein